VVYPGQASLSQELIAEQVALLRLKLPVPKLVRLPLTRGQPFPDLASSFSYEIPPHAAFTVRPAGEGEQVCYLILGDARTLSSAESDFAAYGLSAVAYGYPGLWLNRDPYLAYKAIQSERRFPVPAELPAVKKLVGLSASRLQTIEAQTEIFNGLTEGCLESASPFDYEYLLPPLAPDLSLPKPSPRRELITVRLIHSPQTKPVTSRHFLDQLRGLKKPLSLSLLIEPQGASFQLSFAPEDQAQVERQLRLYFPTLTVAPLTAEPMNTGVHTMLYSSVCRPRYAYLLLRTDLHLNPFSQVLAAMPAGQQEHCASVEVIFQPVSQSVVTRVSELLDGFRRRLQQYAEHKATEAAKYRKENERYFGEWPRWSNDPKDYEKHHDDYMEWLRSYDKKVDEVKRHYESLLTENPRLVQRAKEQMAKLGERVGHLQRKLPAWLASVRITSDSRTLTEQIERSFLRQFETPQQRWQRTPSRAFNRLPEWLPKAGLVSTDELAALVTFPSSALRDQRLETTANVSTAPPPLYTEAGIRLGSAQALGTSYEVTLPDQVRDRHVYVIGRTRSGKSTLLFNMILQDILRGEGVGVIDPHGDLVQRLLEHIPESRIGDTIYLNPTDEKYPVPLNILNATIQENIGVLADDLIITFRRLSESWGERMDSVLRSVVYTLLCTPGATFFDIQQILRDADYRKAVTRDLDFAPLREFWEYDFPQMPKDASQPILHRMSKFALFPTLHAMLSQPSSPLNFDQVMQEKKILLVNLSQGELGEDNSKLIGCLLVSQLQLAAMRRARLPKEQRRPFYLYIDEFQNFTSSAFEKILSEAGKYMLMLTVCHQYISQLDEQTKDALLGNVGTIVVLPVNEKDATQLRHSLGSYELPDILNLDAAKHEALCRPATKASDTFRFVTLAPPAQPEQNFADTIIEQTRARYSRRPVAPQPETTAPDTSQVTETETPPQVLKLERPAPAVPKQFRTTQDRVLHYLNVAEYLSTRQIIALCYSHLAKASQKAAASRDLKQLVEAKQVKAQFVGKEKIFFVGKSCSPTTHNLAVRELFTKIERSGFEIAQIDFCRRLGGLTPDLAIDFVLPDGRQLSTFWEYDAGTEGIAELESKIGRYARVGAGARARVFVYDTTARRAQAMRALPRDACVHAVLSEFESLSDSAFHFAPGLIAPLFS
jgi:Type IV secretion-system coupling protein DNA-binding domain